MSRTIYLSIYLSIYQSSLLYKFQEYLYLYWQQNKVNIIIFTFKYFNLSILLVLHIRNIYAADMF